MVGGDHVRLLPKVTKEGGPAWRKAIEYHTGQPFTAAGTDDVQRQQSDAFLLVPKETMGTLQPSARSG